MPRHGLLSVRMYDASTGTQLGNIRLRATAAQANALTLLIQDWDEAQLADGMDGHTEASYEPMSMQLCMLWHARLEHSRTSSCCQHRSARSLVLQIQLELT